MALQLSSAALLDDGSGAANHEAGFRIFFFCVLAFQSFFHLKSTLQPYLDTEDALSLYLMLYNVDVGSYTG